MKRITELTKEEIRRDREQDGMTLYQLVAKYGISKSTVAGIIKGCDNTRVLKASPSRRVVEDVIPKDRPNLSKVNLGEAARQMICGRLMLNGVNVFKPIAEDTTIDLLVLRSDGSVLKCQCKYIFPEKNGRHIMSLCASRGNHARRVVKHRYKHEEVDVFTGFASENDGVYVIPNKDTNGVNSLGFWIMRKPHGTNGGGIDTAIYLNRFDLLK